MAQMQHTHTHQPDPNNDSASARQLGRISHAADYAWELQERLHKYNDTLMGPPPPTEVGRSAESNTEPKFGGLAGRMSDETDRLSSGLQAIQNELDRLGAFTG